MNKVMSAIGVVLLAIPATSASAHHSYAMFDFQKTVDIKGTVKEFHYTNPHSWIVLLPQSGTGAAASAAAPEMTIEANGPGYLVRNGWKRSSLKPGDLVTITLNPMRDGSPGGSLLKVAFPDGHQLSTR